MPVISCSGDVGDGIVLLSIISQIPGGPHKFLCQTDNATKMKTLQDVSRWLNFFRPLAEAQPYIEECRGRMPNEGVDWDSGGFRGSGLHSRSASLFEAQLSHFVHVKGMGRTMTANKAWLTVEPSSESKGRIICARSGRYRNGTFPWKKIVQHYGDLLLFIGLRHEHQDFSGQFGMVEYRQTQNCLEIAQLIAGSEMFIGNQSSPMAIAEGLKHRTIQETSTDPADCIYFRENAQWVDNGAVDLPDIGGRGELVIRQSAYAPADILTHTTPPGQWRVNGMPPMGGFTDLVKLCKTNNIQPPNGKSLEEWIKLENALRVPDFFFGETIRSNSKNSEAARLNAGYAPRTLLEMMGL